MDRGYCLLHALEIERAAHWDNTGGMGLIDWLECSNN